ncbi:hypothetical protein KI387_010416, partial [Taxus chinensis]
PPPCAGRRSCVCQPARVAVLRVCHPARAVVPRLSPIQGGGSVFVTLRRAAVLSLMTELRGSAPVRK